MLYTCFHFRALRDTLPPEVDLSTKNVSIGYVGKEQQFKILDEEETAPYLRLIEGEERRGAPAERPLGPLRYFFFSITFINANFFKFL